MLVLTRHVGEEIVIDDKIRITVLEVRGNVIRIGVQAPQSVRVLRQELHERLAGLEDASVLNGDGGSDLDDSRIMTGLMRVAR